MAPQTPDGFNPKVFSKTSKLKIGTGGEKLSDSVVKV